MTKMLKVLQREYLVNVKTKGFIIGTIIAPVFMIGIFLLPILLTQVKSEDQKVISVIDRTGIIYEQFAENLDDKLSDGRNKYILMKVDMEHKRFSDVEKELLADIKRNKIDGYIYIGEDILEKNYVDYYARNVTNFQENSRIRNALNNAIIKKRISDEGLDHSTVMKLTRRIGFNTVRISEGEKKEEGKQTIFIAFVFMMLIYMTIILYGSFIMNSIIEEKRSRVIEVLMSSLKPFDIMAGKILGTSLVGLTQYFIWVFFGILIFSFGENIAGSFMDASGNMLDIPSIQPMIFLYFIVYFILGYLLFSGLFSVVGSIVNNESEARSYMFILIMPLLIPILMMSYVISNPDSTLTIALSLFPYTSPIIMIARICVSSPPPVEVIGSMLILAAAIIGEIWLVAKIFRVGILMYGKKPDLKEIIKWVRYS